MMGQTADGSRSKEHAHPTLCSNRSNRDNRPGRGSDVFEECPPPRSTLQSPRPTASPVPAPYDLCRMTPQQFITKWKRVTLSERSACQQHFLDLCELLGQPKPADVDSDGSWYTFERGVHKTGGGKGWADVWMRGHFGWA